MFNVSIATLLSTPYLKPSLGVGESEWAFKHTLEVSEKELGAPNVDLVFEGLDTFATVTLVSRVQYRSKIRFDHKNRTEMKY
jgi:hypothetical protein